MKLKTLRALLYSLSIICTLQKLDESQFPRSEVPNNLEQCAAQLRWNARQSNGLRQNLAQWPEPKDQYSGHVPTGTEAFVQLQPTVQWLYLGTKLGLSQICFVNSLKWTVYLRENSTEYDLSECWRFISSRQFCIWNFWLKMFWTYQRHNEF